MPRSASAPLSYASALVAQMRQWPPGVVDAELARLEAAKRMTVGNGYAAWWHRGKVGAAECAVTIITVPLGSRALYSSWRMLAERPLAKSSGAAGQQEAADGLLAWRPTGCHGGFARHLRIEDARHRLIRPRAVPAEFGVALVRGDHGAELARARATAARSSAASSTRPSGLPGVFSQTSLRPPGHAAGSSDATGTAPTSFAPTAVRSGRRRADARRCRPGRRRSGARSATSSFEPTVGSTSSTLSSATPRRRAYQSTIASRSAGVPTVCG